MQLNCTSLKEITLPASVTVVDNETFRGCTGLERVMLPKSLTEISYYAFSGCTSLTEIVIPETVDTICWGAFSDCTALKKVYFDGDVPAIWGRKASPYNWWGYTYAVVLPEDTVIYYTVSDGKWTSPKWKAPDEVIYKTGRFEWITDPESNLKIPQILPSLRTIQGTITSYGNETDEIVLQLIPEGKTEAEYRTTVTGCKAEYSITDVEPGIYILQVNKKNHIIRTYRIVVE